MHEQLGATVGRCNKSEAAIVVPGSDSATKAHLRGLTFELTGILRLAGFGLGFLAQTWTAAKCPVERRVRRHFDTNEGEALWISKFEDLNNVFKPCYS